MRVRRKKAERFQTLRFFCLCKMELSANLSVKIAESYLINRNFFTLIKKPSKVSAKSCVKLKTTCTRNRAKTVLSTEKARIH